MMRMRWCNVERNEYDLQAKMYATICTHHKQHNNNENKIPVSRNVYAISDRIWHMHDVIMPISTGVGVCDAALCVIGNLSIACMADI